MNRKSSGFTLIELLAVIVVLAILAGVALPRYFDYRQRALDAADEAALSSISTAMINAHLYHRMTEAPPEYWIKSLPQIPTTMETGMLPSGMHINPFWLFDQRGNRYVLEPETEDRPAALVPSEGGPPPGVGKGG